VGTSPPSPERHNQAMADDKGRLGDRGGRTGGVARRIGDIVRAGHEPGAEAASTTSAPGVRVPTHLVALRGHCANNEPCLGPPLHI
jgi:hypothetical protein